MHLFLTIFAGLIVTFVGVMALAIWSAKPDPDDFDPHDN